jgi:hypothetical protein
MASRFARHLMGPPHDAEQGWGRFQTRSSFETRRLWSLERIDQEKPCRRLWTRWAIRSGILREVEFVEILEALDPGLVEEAAF